MARQQASSGAEALTVFSSVLGLLGMVALLVLLAAGHLDEEQLDGPLANIIPPCPAAQRGARCPTCGLSHAFVAMAASDPGRAQQHHPQGPPLFWGFVVLAVLGPGLWLAWTPRWLLGSQKKNVTLPDR